MEGGGDKEKGLSKFELLCYYEGEIHFQHTMLNARLTTYVQSQSFLAGAFAISTNNNNPAWSPAFTLWFPAIFCLLGIVTSVLAYPGISVASHFIDRWRGKVFKLQDEDPSEQDVYLFTKIGADLDAKRLADVEAKFNRMHNLSLIFARRAPFVFGFAWVIFMAVLIVLRVHVA